ncbi:MAG: GNAT family N-acetyltransferase [Eubacterium sp.]|nr:GNAT family N-acetyltransferase [Eubacterium sp.]
MRTIILNNTSDGVKEIFSEFVPLEFEHFLHDEGAVLIGAIDDSSVLLSACGIAIVAIEDGDMVIKWMWVDPEMRYQGSGYGLLNTCFSLAEENGFEEIYAHIPVYEGEEYLDDSEIDDFFTEYYFDFVEKKNSDGMEVFELSADVDTFQAIANNYGNEAYSQSKIQKEYDKFPKHFQVTDVEYFSGV